MIVASVRLLQPVPLPSGLRGMETSGLWLLEAINASLTVCTALDPHIDQSSAVEPQRLHQGKNHHTDHRRLLSGQIWYPQHAQHITQDLRNQRSVGSGTYLIAHIPVVSTFMPVWSAMEIHTWVTVTISTLTVQEAKTNHLGLLYAL